MEFNADFFDKVVMFVGVIKTFSSYKLCHQAMLTKYLTLPLIFFSIYLNIEKPKAITDRTC